MIQRRLQHCSRTAGFSRRLVIRTRPAMVRSEAAHARDGVAHGQMNLRIRMIKHARDNFYREPASRQIVAQLLDKGMA